MSEPTPARTPEQIALSMTGEAHPLADMFPLMEGDEFDALMDDIWVNGLRIPVVVTLAGVILDGRNRFRACRALASRGGEHARVPEHARLKVHVVDMAPEHQAELIISFNAHRRHMSTSQRAMTAARWGDLANFGSLSQGGRASALGVSVATLKHAESVVRSGDADLIASVDAGRVSVSQAAERLRSQARSLPENRSAAAVRRAELARRAEEKRRQQEVRERARAGGAERLAARAAEKAKQEAEYEESLRPPYERAIQDREAADHGTTTVEDPDSLPVTKETVAPYLADPSLLERDDEPVDFAIKPITPPRRHRHEERGSDAEPAGAAPAKPDWATVADLLGVSQAVRSETRALPNRHQVAVVLHALPGLAADELELVHYKVARKAGAEAAGVVYNRLRAGQ